MTRQNEQYRLDIQAVYDDLRETLRSAKGNLTTYSDIIYKIFKPTEHQKKTRAEVSTQPSLRRDVLSKIPPKFWKNPNSKILEPCCGKGGFLVDLLVRLKEGLKEYFTDEEELYRHIVEEMLYFVDIDPQNVEISKMILDPYEKGYKLNYYTGDTLKLDIFGEWGLEGFDLVVGNPPYQNSQNNTGKRGGGDLLWNKFVSRCVKDFVKPQGYMCFIHPSGWRKPESAKSKYKGLFRLLTRESQMIHLDIHGSKDGLRVFNCGTRYDWYVIQKTKPNTNTKTSIRDELGNVTTLNLTEWNFLPNHSFDIIRSLLRQGNEEKCLVIYNSTNYETRKNWTSSKHSAEYKYTLIHSTPKSGTRYYYSSRNDKGHFGIPKVIFGETGIYNAIIDMEGKYGMTQHAMAIQIETQEEGENLKKVLEGDKFKDLLDACSWSN